GLMLATTRGAPWAIGIRRKSAKNKTDRVQRMGKVAAPQERTELNGNEMASMKCYIITTSPDTLAMPKLPPSSKSHPQHGKHDHRACIARAVAKAEALCRDRGVRLTELRRRVLELVWRAHE